MDFKSDILHFSKEKGKRTVLKNCDIITEFTFSKTTFFVVKKNQYAIICCNNNKNDLVLVKYYKGLQPNEAASQFRNEYFKNKITKERLDLFLENPLEHERIYMSKKNKAVD